MLSRRLSSRFKEAGSLSSLLLGIELLDETVAGFTVVALPLLRDQFGLSYAQVGFLFVAGSLSAMILEPIINLLSDRSNSKRSWIIGGLIFSALGAALAACAIYYKAICKFIIIYINLQ